MKNKFPASLWILPICLGLLGGVAAALIASLKYHASWWELLVVGIIVNFLAGVIFWGLFWQAMIRSL